MSQHVNATFLNFEQSHVLDCSPTPTPHHTRAGSPARGKLLAHTSEQASQNIAILHAAIKEPARVSESLKIPVSVVDGSANVSGATKVKYLIIYSVFNLGLTFYNKAIMIKVSQPEHSMTRLCYSKAKILVRDSVLRSQFHVVFNWCQT